MIELYAWPTPNAQKVSILLEELAMAYAVKPVDITKGGQFDPAFLRISPNGRMPAIIDTEAPGGPLAIFESGAILIYLAEKAGRFLPAEPHGRFAALQWVMWQMSGLGPMFGQAFHFRNYAPEPLPYAIDRYSREADRLMGVLERQLEGREFITDALSIADMACYPWTLVGGMLGLDMASFPALTAWQVRMAARPGVVRGMALLEEHRMTSPKLDEEARRNLLGSTRN
ncbi:glutathione S-transferase N-terminal domain-containing protein [Novosphingobium lentum]|uniref:glutathione S-transferase N-terminal domain-containing protein n=1 Tax=Novosphingobium lentum TaxID=145287 RepID=UPI00082CAAD5|nr:glutathione S-transferase N-terminal domain-containing protein [Novosphingobium lentum]